MDEIGNARHRRFAESLRDASWIVDDTGAAGSDAVGFWLYSYNLVTGARLIGQLTLEGYRALQSGEDLKALGVLMPADNLGASLAAYDALPKSARNAEQSERVLSALSTYASSTLTWQSLPPLTTGAMQHFMVFDWLTNSGSRVFRPAAAMNAPVLDPDTLAVISQQVLNAHLANHPHEAPI